VGRHGNTLTGGASRYPDGRRPRVAVEGEAVRLTRRVFTEVEELRVALDDTRDARALEPDLARVFCTRPPELGQLAAEVVRMRDAARAKRDRGRGE